MLAPPHGLDEPSTNNNLDCLTGANVALEAKGLFGLLPNNTDPPPDPEIERPASAHADSGPSVRNCWQSKSDTADTPPAPEKQESVCENCGSVFEPRKGSGGGKPQRFCSPECRKGSQCPNATVPNGNDAPSVGANIDTDVGKSVSGFDWNDTDLCIAIERQLTTALYWNGGDSLVIRQWNWPDDDHYIVITKQNLDAFLDRLTDFCGIPSVGGP